MANLNRSYIDPEYGSCSGSNIEAKNLVSGANESGGLEKIDNPGIPLVGMNGGFPHYGSGGKPFKYENVGARLARRKELFFRRKAIADCALIFALLGIIIMMCHIEFCMANVWPKDSIGGILMKAAVSLTTVILLGFIVWFHYLDVKVFMIDNSMEDWRLALSASRVFRLMLELLICVVHPPPGRHDFKLNFVPISNTTKIVCSKSSQVPIDVIFSLPMFLRFYLVCRVILLHSKLFQDASSQSLGALNRIHFNFRFIFKSMMNLHAEYVLTILISCVFIGASWAFRACEMYYGEPHSNLLNSMWLIAITFLSVGYGDITPASYCGRTIAVMAGISGALCTALTVAVLTRKLELSRAETYVHNFVIDVELGKNLKHAAANIVKEGWLVHKYKSMNLHAKKLKHQRRLLQAIHRVRDLKNKQRRLADNCVTMVEMFKNQTYLISKIESVEQCLKDVESRMASLDIKLDALLLKK